MQVSLWQPVTTESLSDDNRRKICVIICDYLFWTIIVDFSLVGVMISLIGHVIIWTIGFPLSAGIFGFHCNIHILGGHWHLMIFGL